MSEKNAESGFPESHKRPKDLKESATIIFRELEASEKKTFRFVECVLGFVIGGTKCKEAETDIPYDFDHRIPENAFRVSSFLGGTNTPFVV